MNIRSTGQDSGGDRSHLAEEAYRQTVTEQYYNGCPDLHEVFFRPLTGGEWKSLGYATGPTVTMGYATDSAEAVVVVPHQHGKAALTASIDVEVPLTDGLRSLFDALAAAHSRELGRRLHRLADDLGQWEPHVRVGFQRVQQVLEETGIGDGYGQLTIPQPVYPPIEPPLRRH